MNPVELALLGFGVLTPLLLISIYVSSVVAVAIVLMLIATYKVEAVVSDEGRKNKRLLRDIRNRRI